MRSRPRWPSPRVTATPKTLLSVLLDPAVKVGTSSRRDDPGGAYAWAMFKKADVARPGSRAKLEAKASTIGSGQGMLAIPPNTKNAVAWLFEARRLDVFLSYCTNGRTAQAALPGVSTVDLPPQLAVTANYGLAVLKGANEPQASQFALFILSPAGQAILAAHGFDAPLRTSGQMDPDRLSAR